MWQSLLCLVLTCQEPQTDILRNAPTVKVTTVLSPPFMMKSEDAGEQEYKGLLHDVLMFIESELGIQFEINESEDGHYGVLKSSSRQWNGMLGEIMRGEADLAVADLSMSTKRTLAVDWTVPIMQTGISTIVNTDNISPVPSSIEQLIDEVDKFYVYAVGSTMAFLMYSEDPLVKRIYEKHEPFGSNAEAISALKNRGEKAAVVLDFLAGKYEANSDCRIRVVGEPLTTINYGFALRKGAAFHHDGKVVEYRTLLNWAIVEMQASGKLKKAYDRWFQKGNCELQLN